eukprot:TRINITY_DN16901_c0_g1_i1.p1 TRINITY_DN16901_c0_g1~~TRINITY_DN16901_c0_g1_i1.p1  ORF type:complete len:138 (-),score=29.12 TRINITY_DN16901_c0_g1_i1:34-423(-)
MHEQQQQQNTPYQNMSHQDPMIAAYSAMNNPLTQSPLDSKRVEEEYRSLLKESVKQNNFGGYEIKSPETLHETFGEHTQRGKWLKKEARDLLFSDVPALLLDYQQLAAEHINLIDKYKRLHTLNQKNTK